MLKFLASKASVLSIVPRFRSFQCYTAVVHQECVLFWRDTIVERRTCMQVTSLGCRSYATKLPQRDIEVQADDIWRELCDTNRLPATDVHNCREIIKFLLSFKYQKSHIVRDLSENAGLLQFPMSRWKETVSCLQSYGFKGPHILPLLTGCHMLLHGTAWNNLQEVLMFLNSVHVPYQRRLQVVARNPTLLSDDTRPIAHNYGNLLKVFSKDEVQTLIAKNPSLLTDPVEDTNKKINYLYNKMGIRSKEIMRSCVFEHSLAHIITRHQFAEHAGVYKMPDRHEISAKEMNLQTVVAYANPSLSDLVDTSNAAFVHSFCSMTVAEYKVFEAMMAEELHEVTEDDADSDLSDSDSSESE